MPNAIAINLEDRPITTLGFPHDTEHLAPAQADVAVERASELAEEYTKEAVLLVNGQTVDPLVGAAAVYRAYWKVFGVAPRIIAAPSGRFPATEKPFTLQEFQYQLKDGTTVLETELDAPRFWDFEKITKYLERWHPEIPLPQYIRSSEREKYLALMKGTLTPIAAPTKMINVPWGCVAHPADPEKHIAEGDIFFVCWEADAAPYGRAGTVAQFLAFAKRRHQRWVDEFYDEVLKEIPRVYANRFLEIGNGGRVSFIDPYERVNRDEVVHTQEMTEELDIRVRGILRHPVQARTVFGGRIPNRKTLFTGEAGTGKTVSMLALAQEALEQGWTIIQCQPGSEHDFAETMRFAAMHKKVVVIIEDLEKMMPDAEGLTTKERLEARSKLLDLFDGGKVKGTEVQFWLTSNYPKLWISAMARPGRVDAYFEFLPLDREGFEKLIRVKIGIRLGDVDFDEIWDEVGGMSSSFLASVADYARECLLGKPDGYQLVTADLKPIVRGMKRQYEWYSDLVEQETADREQTLSEHYGALIGPVVAQELTQAGLK